MNDLIIVNNHISIFRKLNKKKVIICIIILLLIILGIIFGVIKLKEYKQKKEEEIVEKVTELQMITIKKEQEQIKNQEAEIKMNRNKNNLTIEQINSIIHIYKSNSDTEKKVAYLTFDDGPSATVTPLILDVLKQENIKATFFVLGTNVKRNPEILRRIKEEGHYIANHGYSHVYSSIYSSAQAILEEYNQTEQCIKEAVGDENYKTRIFRFPGGSSGGKYAQIKSEAKQILVDNGIAYLDWNALTCDAEGTPTKESIMQNLQNTTDGKSTVVILMHDASNKILTYETLKDVIDYLRNQGYEFGDIYDLIGE